MQVGEEIVSAEVKADERATVLEVRLRPERRDDPVPVPLLPAPLEVGLEATDRVGEPLRLRRDRSVEDRGATRGCGAAVALAGALREQRGSLRLPELDRSPLLDVRLLVAARRPQGDRERMPSVRVIEQRVGGGGDLDGGAGQA